MNKEKFDQYIAFAVSEVKRSHEFAGDIWIMPTPRESLLFVLCECSEVLDAILRLNPTFMRNNDKGTGELKVYQELIDVAIMLIKSQLAEQEKYQKWDFPLNADINDPVIIPENRIAFAENAAVIASEYIAAMLSRSMYFDSQRHFVKAEYMYEVMSNEDASSYNELVMTLLGAIFELFDHQEVTTFESELTGKIDRTIAKAAKVREERENAAN